MATATLGGLEHFREAIDRALVEADSDERLGPLLGATGLRLCVEFTDANAFLNVTAGEGERNLSWSFADVPDPTAQLVLRMETAVANRWLLGGESIPIGIARGRVRCSGGSRAALRYLPATKLLAAPYRRVVERDFPDLLAA